MRIKGPIRRKRRARLVVEADVLASIGIPKFDVEAEPGHEYDLRNVEMKFLATLPRGLWRFLKAAAIIEEGVHNSALSPFDRDLSKHTWFKWGLWILKEGPLPQIPIKKRNYEEVRQEAQEALDAVGGELKYWYQQYRQLERRQPDDPLFDGVDEIFRFDDGFNCFVTTNGDDTSFFDIYFANLYHCCTDREPDFKKIEPDILRLFEENWTTFAPDLGTPFDMLDARFREIVDWFCVKKNQSAQDKPQKPQGTKTGRKTVAHSTITATDANRYLYIEDASCIKVATPKGEQVFKFTRASEWEVVNRFTLSLSNGENNDVGHYPVKFTYMDSNRCKGECRAFLKRFTEQQPVAKKVRNRKHEDWARFKVELLGGKPFR